MSHLRPIRLMHITLVARPRGRKPARGERSRSEADDDFDEKRQVLVAFDVGMRQRLRKLERARRALRARAQADAGARGGLAARHVLLEGGADVVEPVERRSAETRGRTREASARLDLRAGAAIAGDLGNLETAPEPLAADLEALGVR